MNLDDLLAPIPGDDQFTKVAVILLAIVFVMVFGMPIRSAITGFFDMLTHPRLRKVQREMRRANRRRRS